MEELLKKNDLVGVKTLCSDKDFVGFDFDPLEYLFMNKINAYTVQIIYYLIENFDFKKEPQYINTLLQRTVFGQYEKKVLIYLLEDKFKIDESTLALAKHLNCMDIILDNVDITTKILNSMDIMRTITKDKLGQELIGNIVILETAKGDMGIDRDLIFYEEYYIHDKMYSITHDGCNNPDNIIYKIYFIYNNSECFYFIDNQSKQSLQDSTVLTFSINLVTEVLATRINEVPFSADLYTLIKRDVCSSYL